MKSIRKIYTYPKISPARLTNESILIIMINEQNPVISNNRDNGQKWRNIEFDLELSLIAVRISLISRSLNEASFPTAPSLVQNVHSAVIVESVGGSGVHAVTGLKP